MGNNVIYCTVYLFCVLAVVDCVNVNSEKILGDDFIEEINNLQNVWKAGRNFHRNSELRNLISVNFNRVYNLEFEVFDYNITIPLSFDSRKNWPLCTTIGSVFTQGNCASSHAIVAASVFSDRMCVQTNVVRTSSVDQLLTCCKKCGAGCFGGHIENCFTYMKKVGLITGGGFNSKSGCRPYKIPHCPTPQKTWPLCPRIREKTPSCYYMKCTNRNYKTSYDSDKIKINKIFAIPSDIAAIQSEIMTNGSVSSTFTIYEDFFNYKKGIYYHVLGEEVGQLDVKIIGWGKLKNTPYWIVVNSWGKIWGDQGTFKIRLGTNECNIEAHILAGSFF